jgi:hypothetical protein
LVVAIAFVVPRFIQLGNTDSAIVGVRTIVNAATTYQTEYGYYPDSLEQMSQLKGTTSSKQNYEWLTNGTWADHRRNGYVFTYRAFDKKHEGKLDSFTINADPIQPSCTGCWHFFSSEDGVIHMESDQPALASSPPLGS